MRYSLLGPLEVRNDGHIVPLGGAKQRALLVVLLLHANEVVSRDRLLDALWPERPPGDAAHSLDHQVSRLRKVLDPPELLATSGSGYVLAVGPADLDVQRFENSLGEGRQANSVGRPTEALAALDRGLALWRGAALADVADEPFARIEARRLDELRVAAIEERIDARLSLGHHHQLVPELESLVAHHPLRERLRAQLMLALYRSGRQAEALHVYSDTRRELVETLGLDPGAELQQLEQAILRHDPALAPPRPPRSRRSRRVAAVALVPVAAAAVVAGILLVNRDGARRTASSPVDAIALVSARTGASLGRIDGVRSPLSSAFYRGALWSLSSDGILSKIDPQTSAVLGAANTVPLPCGLAAGGGALWVSDCSSPTVIRVDPVHDVVVGQTTLPTPRAKLADATQSIASGAGSIWVGQGFDNPSYVWRLDPASGRVQRRYVIPEGGAEAVTFGDGAVWVGGGVIGRLTRIDPSTNQVTTPGRDLHRWLCCVAAGGGYVWAAINPGGTVWKLSEDGDVLSSVKLGSAIGELDYADGAVWAAAGEAGALIRIDPTTDATKAYRVGHHVMGSAVRAGVLAVAIQPAVRDVTAGIHGRIATVALTEDDLDAPSTDPLAVNFAFNPTQVEFHYATCAKLFNYPDAAGTAGETPVPEVAKELPSVSDGGRVYTFRIRAGYGFSPPSHEQVTAASFRHAIERFLSPAAHSYDPLGLLGDVIGARAFATGEASRLAGVSAHGDTLVIHLRRAASDLPARLALPTFCAVPADLPTVAQGLPYPVPSAGPYYLADRAGNVLVLEQNPNYHGPRPRHLDAIVYRIGVEPGLAAAGIERSRLDYVASQDAVLAPATVAARAAGRRYRVVPNNWTARLALNPSRQAFADATVRRAVAYALDRRRLAQALTNGAFQLPTSALLPPNLRRSGRAAYALSADLRAARILMRGRRIHIVFAAQADDADKLYEPRVALAVRRQLSLIGIRVTVVPVRQTLTHAQRDAALAAADVAQVDRNAGDARDALGYLLGLPYLTAADQARLTKLETLSPRERASAATNAAAMLTSGGRYVAYADGVTPEIVSERIGCAVDQPEYPGLDLAAMCITRR